MCRLRQSTLRRRTSRRLPRTASACPFRGRNHPRVGPPWISRPARRCRASRDIQNVAGQPLSLSSRGRNSEQSEIGQRLLRSARRVTDMHTPAVRLYGGQPTRRAVQRLPNARHAVGTASEGCRRVPVLRDYFGASRNLARIFTPRLYSRVRGTLPTSGDARCIVTLCNTSRCGVHAAHSR